jgi:Glycosyltransferase family 92
LHDSTKLVVKGDSQIFDAKRAAGRRGMKTSKKGSVLEPHMKSSHIFFRPFLHNPRLHNISVEGNVLPGPFYNDQLFLLGLRLTSSYEKSNSQVHVDVFGFPGDFVGTVENRFCDIHSLPRQWNLYNYSAFATGNQALYCQLECRNSFNTFSDCGAPIPMEFIPLVSGDGNQNSVSLIWRCNVTDYLNRSSLIERSKLSNSTHSVRVSLYLNDSMSNEKSAVLHNISQIDIPLHTAVAGYGGPQIRPTDKSYFTEIQDKSRIRVGMCVSIFQSHPAKFFPEFIQHHKNIGIEQILIGIDANLDSSDLDFVEAIIQPYINEGLVVIQAINLNDYFKCDTDVPKIQFYHQCLYHFKGITKYIVTWDIDEYWIPPNRLETSGNNGFKKYREGKRPDDAMEAEIDLNKTSLASQRFITKSPKSSFSTHVTNDILWQGSNYSKSIGIHDVIQAIDQFHIQHGCRDKWCFHLFPSYTVTAKKDFQKENCVAHDFLYRESQSNLVWKKALTQTRFAMMNGYHIGGSCKLPSSPHFFAQAEDANCFPISWIDGEFGSVHHYLNLIANREDSLKSNPIEDEYVIRFGNSVLEQLKEINRSSLPS